MNATGLDDGAMRARLAEIDAGNAIRGWWCMAGICQAWNGEELAKRATCRHCGRAKVARA